MNELPKGWINLQLREVGYWFGGGTPSKVNPRFWVDGTIPWVSPKDMKSDRITDAQDHINEDAVEQSTTRLAEPGSVLVVTRSSILQHTLPVAVTQRSVAFNQDLKAIKPHENVLPSYLALSLKAFEREILHACSKTGTTVQSLDMSRLLSFTIPIAPIAEQHRIVLEAEKQFTRLQAGLTALERLQANIKRYSSAVIKAACEGKLVATESELAKEQGRIYESADVMLSRILAERKVAKGGLKDFTTPLDKNNLPILPEGWTWVTMPQLGELGRGKSKHRPRNDARLYTGPYPFIQTGDVRRSGGTITEYAQTYSELGLQQSRLWPAGTLCITIAANIAETGVLQFPSCFPDSVVGFIHNGSPSTTRYVELFIRTIKDRLAQFAPATAQKNINLDVLQKVAIPLPPLAEQIRLVEEVERRLSVIQKIDTKTQDNIQRATRLQAAILTKAVNGKLVEQSSDDEPAQQVPSKTHSNSKNSSKRANKIFKPNNMERTAVKNLDELLECLDTLGNSADPALLLAETGLDDNIDTFFEILREGRKSEVLDVPVGNNGPIRRIKP